MAERTGIYFVSDVHLGLRLRDPEDREARFVHFLKGVPRDARALYLLGDIWDFWYEYRDVIPKEGIRVVAELIAMMDAGVEVYFFEGNHDMWSYSFFESIGMKKLKQPYIAEIDGQVFCLGHGDLLGGARFSYRLMMAVFHSRVARWLFSTLHPWLAFRFGLGWSNGNRRKHTPYHFGQQDEPLLHFAEELSSKQHIDYFIFGHFHDSVDLRLSTGARFFIVKDWMDGGEPYLYFSGTTVLTGHSQKTE